MSYPTNYTPQASDGIESLAAQIARSLGIMAESGDGMAQILAKIAAAAQAVQGGGGGGGAFVTKQSVLDTATLTLTADRTYIDLTNASGTKLVHLALSDPINTERFVWYYNDNGTAFLTVKQSDGTDFPIGDPIDTMGYAQQIWIFMKTADGWVKNNISYY